MDVTSQNKLILAISFVLLAIMAFFFPGGYYGYDELEYARLAYQLTTGEFRHDDNPYSYRYTTFVPLSLIYILFGMNDLANNLFTLLAFIALLSLVLSYLKYYPLPSRIVAAGFLTFVPIHLVFVGKPMPDVFVEIGTFLMIWGYLRSKEDSKIKMALFMFSTGAILVFFAKETFLLLYPFFIFLIVEDLRKGNSLAFWWRAVLIIIAVLIIWAIGNFLFLGNALSRVHAIFNNRYVGACSYDFLPFSVTIERIGYTLWVAFIRKGMLLPFITAIGLWRLNVLTANEKFILRTWFILLLLSNFMTISYHGYVPLCDDPRHYMFTLPFGGIIMAMAIKYLDQIPQQSLGLSLVALTLFVAIGVYFQHEVTWSLGVIWAIGIGIAFIIKHQWLVSLILTIGISIFYFQTINYHDKIDHYAQRELINWALKAPGEHKMVLADPGNINIGNFYSAYDTLSVEWVDMKETPVIPDAPDKYKYLIINGMTLYMSGMQWDQLPEYARFAHEKYQKRFENNAGVVYEIPRSN